MKETDENKMEHGKGKKSRFRKRGKRKKKKKQTIVECFGCSINIEAVPRYKQCRCSIAYCSKCWKEVFFDDAEVVCYNCQDLRNCDMTVIVNSKSSYERILAEMNWKSDCENDSGETESSVDSLTDDSDSENDSSENESDNDSNESGEDTILIQDKKVVTLMLKRRNRDTVQ